MAARKSRPDPALARKRSRRSPSRPRSVAPPSPAIGTIGWVDLTVPDAAKLRDFYAAVVGWKPRGIDMGGYEDWSMTTPAGGVDAAGICWARGRNAGLPAQWLVYITVADLKTSIAAVRRRRGRVLFGPRELAGGQLCVIRDPAGAVCALFQP